MAVSLVPAFGTLYQRLTMKESIRYEKTRQLIQSSEPMAAELKKIHSENVNEKTPAEVEVTNKEVGTNPSREEQTVMTEKRKKHFSGEEPTWLKLSSISRH